MKPGERYRVKATPPLRRYGIRVHGGSTLDTHAWPNEIGTVELREWTALNGDRMSCLRLVFSRGRSTTIPEARGDDDEGYWVEKLREFKAQFAKVRA